MEKPGSLNYLQPGPMAPTGSVSAAAAPYEATGRLVAEASNQLAGLVMEGLRHKEAGEMAAFFTEADEEWSRFSAELLKRDDPENWESEWKKKVSTWQADINKKKWFGDTKERAAIGLMNWSARRTGTLIQQSAVRNLEEGRARIGYNMQSHVDNNDLEGYAYTVDTGIQMGVFKEYERDILMKRGEQLILERELDLARDENPQLLLRQLQEGEYNLDPNERARQIKLTRDSTRKFLDTQTGEIMDKIVAGEIKSPEDIERFTQGWRPTAKLKMQEYLREYQDDQYQEYLKDPDVQNQVAGEASQIIREYKPNGEAFDSGYVEARMKIEQMQPGPLKDELKKQLDSIRDGKEREIKDVKDWGFEQIKEMRDAGLMGKVPEVRKIETTFFEYLDDGYFEDTSKIVALGYTEEQAEEIQNAKKKGDKEITIDAQVDKFRELWKARPNQATASGFDWEFGQRLATPGVSVGSKFTSRPDPESELAALNAESQINQKQGKMMEAYGIWAKNNPNATIDETANYLKAQGVFIQAGPTNESWKPTRPGSMGDIPKTSLNLPDPLKKYGTSFDYYGKKYGVDPRFLAAISQLETANGTSSAFRNKKNAMGVSNSKGPIAFQSTEASIEKMARVLASPKGPYKDAKTLRDFAKIYAPPGASNDPNKTNAYWPEGVKKYLQQQGVTDPENARLIYR